MAFLATVSTTIWVSGRAMWMRRSSISSHVIPLPLAGSSQPAPAWGPGCASTLFVHCLVHRAAAVNIRDDFRNALRMQHSGGKFGDRLHDRDVVELLQRLPLSVKICTAAPHRRLFLDTMLCGLRLPIRPLSVPAFSSITKFTKVGLPASMAAFTARLNSSGDVTRTPPP